MAEEQGNIKQQVNTASIGMNQDASLNQLKKGSLTYALNAAIENFDGNSISYQNELGNEICISFPEGYVLIGSHNIVEQSKYIVFITNPSTGGSQIGYFKKSEDEYKVIVNSPCLNFNVLYPIHKVAHRITNCSTEIYWTDGFNPRRYMDIDNVPKILKSGSPLCNPVYTDDLDCNQLRVQPNFVIPHLNISDVRNGGDLVSGVYQFGIQYADALGNPYTSYYSITNPLPIANTQMTTNDFNYSVGKSIVINVNNLDITGMFKYYNIAVIKTINAISSVELVGTYSIEQLNDMVIYTGQNKSDIRLSINDIFEKFPYYEVAQDLTSVQDVLVWDQLSSIDRINYQQIASKVRLLWESWRIPASEDYSEELNATHLRGYLRDEVYAFEIQFILGSGKETDGFHIPGREKTLAEQKPDVPDTHDDFVGSPSYYQGDVGYSPYWKIYNTASVTDTYSEYTTNKEYKGKYQFGEFAYWESEETYPCNTNIWGELAGKKIRHHKFPDVSVSPIFESKQYNGTLEMGKQAVYPLGVKVSPQQIQALINSSSLTQEQKDDIVGFKILRGDRATNKSIVAKGMLRNVGSYTRDEKETYFPNYPYNDLNEDRFLNNTNNAYSDVCTSFEIIVSTLVAGEGGEQLAELTYMDCDTNLQKTQSYYATGNYTLCAIGKPSFTKGTGKIGYKRYERWKASRHCNTCRGYRVGYQDRWEGYVEKWISQYGNFQFMEVVPDSGGVKYIEGPGKEFIKYMDTVGENDCAEAGSLPSIREKESLAYRQIFNSPETSFGQPFLGNILKIENVMYGAGKANFAEVKKNAKYKLLTKEAQEDALRKSEELVTDAFDASSLFAAYQAYLTTYINGITRRNYARSFNSIASYDYWMSVENEKGIKQRNLDISKYLIPAVVSTGDDKDINNYQRESSVYLRTELDKKILPFPDATPSMLSTGLKEESRFTISEKGNCLVPEKEEPIKVISYYASLKNDMINQWGQIYSYDVIDTGYQHFFNRNEINTTVFGGDTFISKFSYKVKLPFFIDNRVGAPDDSDIFYDEIGNIAYPKYWHSARSVLVGKTIHSVGMTNIISYKAHHFDCPNSQGEAPGTQDVETSPGRTYYDGYYYLFAYGIPSFYCETSYNLDLRQAFNNREGDFFPHVSSGIPNDWLQESFVSIAQDNTYYYNTTYSKQNKENTFTHLPADWEDKLCLTHYPFRAIYSDVQSKDADNKVNAWRIYRAISYYDFPQSYGKLIALDGIQNSAVLARFENKTLLYNNLLTIDTSNPQAAFIGNPMLFRGAPPIDFADTDLGYVGTQHKMLLKTPYGQISVDAKRGQVFLIQGSQVDDLSGFSSGMSRFLTEHLSFEILRWFPDVDIDNNFNGIGIHGVYDNLYDRIIITKLDFVPVVDGIKFDGKEFYIEESFTTIIYDCNLEGMAQQILYCELEGTAQQVGEDVTTTTTTSSSSTTSSTTTVYTEDILRILAVGNGSASQYSDYGIQWKDSTIAGPLRTVIAKDGIWTAFNFSNSRNIYRSYDKGFTWNFFAVSPIDSTQGTWDVRWTGQNYIICGQGNTCEVAISPDMINWTPKLNSVGGMFYGLACNGGKVLTGSTVSGLYYSVNHGVDWVRLNDTIAIPVSMFGACWNGSIWVVVGSGASDSIMTSTDPLVNWTVRGHDIFSGAQKVAWNGTMFVAVGTGANHVAYSYDGIEWIGGGLLGTMNIMYDVLWDGSIWVIGGSNTQEGPVIYTSPDGINWTPRGISVPFGQSVYGLGAINMPNLYPPLLSTWENFTTTTTTTTQLTTTTTTIAPTTTTTTTTMIEFLNAGFENWTLGEADGWTQVIDSVGGTTNNVTLTQEASTKREGNYSAKVQSVQPCGGIQQEIGTGMPSTWDVYVTSGKAAMHYAKANGSSAYFTDHSLLQENFILPTTSELSSAIRNIHALRIDNGDFIELFSASSSSETSSEGAVYMKRNSGAPSLFLNFASHKSWTWAGVMDMTTKYVFVTMRIGVDGQQHLYATDVTRDFSSTSNDRLLFDIANTNVQCYSMLKLVNGTIVLPIVYAQISQVSTGPWYLDILTTTDFNSVTRLNDPKTYTGRGLMEAYPVLLSDATVAILCRTNQGHLAKCIYNPSSGTLSSAVATDVIQPESGSFARNLSDGSILLSWIANTDLRKVVVMAISSDDMISWQSFHILVTSEAMGDSMTSQPPYVHQPFIYEDSNGDLIAYFERVITTSSIELYKTTSSEYSINNICNVLNGWTALTLSAPVTATHVQLLNIWSASGTAYFDQPAPSTTTTTTTAAPTTTTTTTIAVDIKTSLISVWELNEPSGTVANDSHGTNHMNYIGSPLLAQTSPTGLTGAVTTNGTDQAIVSQAVDVIPNAAENSVSFWFNSTTAGATTLKTGWSIEGGYFLHLSLASNGGMLLSFSGSTAGATNLGGTYTNGAWHHIVGTNNGTTTVVYIDGAQVASFTNAKYNIGGISRTTGIAGRYDGVTDNRYLAAGTYAQLAVWTRVLTLAEVQQLYNNGNGLAYTNW